MVKLTIDNIPVEVSENTTILEAAKAAQCDEFVNRLPQGYETRIGEVYDILREGSAKARAAAAETLADVRAAMKINYFDDRELIDGQTEHFKLKTEN